MKKIFGIAIIALVAASCESSGNNRVVEPVAPPTTTFTPSATPLVDSNNPNAATATPPPTNNSNAAVALNPAHGAPGHRCDIPVGAPLNGAAGNAAAAPSPNAAPPMIQMQPQSAPSGQTARLNPAHGAPGHDCSIPVGQP